MEKSKVLLLIKKLQTTKGKSGKPKKTLLHFNIVIKK